MFSTTLGVRWKKVFRRSVLLFFLINGLCNVSCVDCLISQNEYFKEEYQRGDLKFATSAFHAYAHQSTCQLKYNPRLNKGHGLTDGEGNERIWSDNDPLIAPNRCATKQHRVDAIDLKSSHGNETRCNHAGMSYYSEHKDDGRN